MPAQQNWSSVLTEIEGEKTNRRQDKGGVERRQVTTSFFAGTGTFPSERARQIDSRFACRLRSRIGNVYR